LRFLQKSWYASPVVPPAALPSCQSCIPGLNHEKTILSLLHRDVVEHRPRRAVDDMLLIVLWVIVASCPSCRSSPCQGCHYRRQILSVDSKTWSTRYMK
jgi:hypothetical protein